MRQPITTSANTVTLFLIMDVPMKSRYRSYPKKHLFIKVKTVPARHRKRENLIPYFNTFFVGSPKL